MDELGAGLAHFFLDEINRIATRVVGARACSTPGSMTIWRITAFIRFHPFHAYYVIFSLDFDYNPMVIYFADCEAHFECFPKMGIVAPAESENHPYLMHLVRV
jgi:hypothetical protein